MQDQARSNVFEVHDNTKVEFVEEIKSKHQCKLPLASIEESTPYNDLLDLPHLSLKAQKNEEIFSISDGVVEKVGFTKRQETTLRSGHSKDFISTYSHCSKIIKNKGEFINPMLLFDDI